MELVVVEEVRRYGSAGASEEAPGLVEEAGLRKTSAADSKVQL